MNDFEIKIRELFRRGPELQRPVSRHNCPSPEELSQSFEPDCPVEIKARIIDHVFSCPACQQEFELLRGSRPFIDRLGQTLTRHKQGFTARIFSVFSSSVPWWKAAAAVVLLLGILSLIYLGITYWNNWNEERRAEATETIVLFEAVNWPQPALIKLAWKSSEQNVRYRVEVYDQNMYLVWQSPLLSETGVILPDKVLEALKDYQYFFWQLLIYSGQDKVSESQVRKVRLGPQ
ncbi:MAG: hypothetical protein QHH44_08550 [Candidatus Saccharicenans sp.]|jgi:hypothetical protein|nr:hypothetical protein [Candidatus Saccharicenans sp.]